jgi:hypothetical protein
VVLKWKPVEDCDDRFTRRGGRRITVGRDHPLAGLTNGERSLGLGTEEHHPLAPEEFGVLLRPEPLDRATERLGRDLGKDAVVEDLAHARLGDTPSPVGRDEAFEIGVCPVPGELAASAPELDLEAYQVPPQGKILLPVLKHSSFEKPVLWPPAAYVAEVREYLLERSESPPCLLRRILYPLRP